MPEQRTSRRLISFVILVGMYLAPANRTNHRIMSFYLLGSSLLYGMVNIYQRNKISITTLYPNYIFNGDFVVNDSKPYSVAQMFFFCIARV